MRRMLGAALAAGLLVVVPASVVQARAATSVAVAKTADWEDRGLYINVGLTVACDGGVNGMVSVTVRQDYPETPEAGGVTGTANGPEAVVCDGVAREVAVFVVSDAEDGVVQFDAGLATVTARVSTPGGGVVATKTAATRIVP